MDSRMPSRRQLNGRTAMQSDYVAGSLLRCRMQRGFTRLAKRRSLDHGQSETGQHGGRQPIRCGRLNNLEDPGHLVLANHERHGLHGYGSRVESSIEDRR